MMQKVVQCLLRNEMVVRIGDAVGGGESGLRRGGLEGKWKG
jgi:hypothetical protein